VIKLDIEAESQRLEEYEGSFQQLLDFHKRDKPNCPNLSYMFMTSVGWACVEYTCDWTLKGDGW